jgi:hypothetical protein
MLELTVTAALLVGITLVLLSLAEEEGGWHVPGLVIFGFIATCAMLFVSMLNITT